VGAARRRSHGTQGRLDRHRAALGAHARGALELAPLRLGIEPVNLDRLGRLLGEAVDPDDDALARLDLRLVAKRRLLDLPLDEAGLDRRDGAAERVDALDQLERALLE